MRAQVIGLLAVALVGCDSGAEPALDAAPVVEIVRFDTPSQLRVEEEGPGVVELRGPDGLLVSYAWTTHDLSFRGPSVGQVVLESGSAIVTNMLLSSYVGDGTITFTVVGGAQRTEETRSITFVPAT